MKANSFAIHSSISFVALHLSQDRNRCKSALQSAVTTACICTIDRNCNRFRGPNQDDQILASRDARIEQIPLEHHVMLSMNGYDYSWELAPLTLVD